MRLTVEAHWLKVFSWPTADAAPQAFSGFRQIAMADAKKDAKARQYLPTMKKVQEYLDEQWSTSGQDIAGAEGFKAVHLEGVRASRPPLPIFLYLLASCSLMSNGAAVSVWGSLWPVVIWVVNCNYSQTRKSALTGLADRIASVVDGHVRGMWARALRAKQSKKDGGDGAAGAPAAAPGGDGAAAEAAERAEEAQAGEEAGGSEDSDDGEPEREHSLGPVTWYCAYLGGATERCKERCSGDFGQIRFPKLFKNLPELNRAEALAAGLKTKHERKVAQRRGLQGKVWFSQELIFDEAYDFLMALDMLDSPSSAAAKKNDAGLATGQSPNAGWANRLLQYGKGDHETKSCGVHGGADAPPVNASVVGNIHPGVCVEMIRGVRGDHGCQTRARMMFVSGNPVQPCEQYPGFGVEAKTEWCMVPEHLVALLDFDGKVGSVAEAAAFFGGVETDVAQEETFDPAGYYPSEKGWQITLPDGVRSRLRLCKKEDGDHVVEWLLPDRDVAVPPELDVKLAAQEFVKNFEVPHRQLHFDEKARQLFLSYSTYFNIRVKLHREQCLVDDAASLGACPWKLAMLSSVLALWDLMWHQNGAEAPAEQAPNIIITEGVVTRAFRLLEILENILMLMRDVTGDEEATSAFSKAEPAARHEDDEEREAAAFLRAPPRPDADFAEKAQSTGLMDTAVARGLLEHAKAVSGAPGTYEACARDVYRLITANEVKQKKLQKPRVGDGRAVLAMAPAKLGNFDAAADKLVFVLPAEAAAQTALNAELASYCNSTVQDLRAHLNRKQSEKRGAAGREGRAAKRAKGAAGQAVEGDGQEGQGADQGGPRAGGAPASSAGAGHGGLEANGSPPVDVD